MFMSTSVLLVYMSEPDSQRTVNATQTSVSVLEALAEADDTVGVTELANRLSIPKSTAYKHLNTLYEVGFVNKTGRKYELGLRLADLGERARATDPLYRTARPHIDQLVSVTDQPAGLVIEHEGLAVDLYRTTPARQIQVQLPNSRYLHCSAPGKAILASLSSERVMEILDETGLPQKTDRTLSDRSALREKLDRIDERGIAFERGEQRPSRRAVAVPITQNGSVLGAVYVAGTSDRLKSKRFEEDLPGILISTVKRFLPDL